MLLCCSSLSCSALRLKAFLSSVNLHGIWPADQLTHQSLRLTAVTTGSNANSVSLTLSAAAPEGSIQTSSQLFRESSLFVLDQICPCSTDFSRSMLIQAFRNILVVVKQTPYESYLQLKAQGKAPVRWGSINEDLLSPLLAVTHSLIISLSSGCLTMGTSQKSKRCSSA